MARRARQGSVARCPYCEAFLPQVAAECPECRFPLTMAAADVGFSTSEPSGTTSTATPGGRSARPVVAGGPSALERSSALARRAQRMRIGAWLLGLLSILLLLAGLGVVFTAASPTARTDREATTSLLTALRRATDDPNHRSELTITPLRAGVPSDSPVEVSVDRASGLWFGAARSTEDRCFLLVGRLDDGVPLGRGTLGAREPCTGAQVRLRSEPKLVKAGG